ncbi:MAG: hypothetical protein K8S25_18010 [Alphaproteobacteria bacterium]|nr:hypothetical protein [Alphaproteobacteria bacterium]
MHALRVRFDDFADAALRIIRMRRAPAGARGSIPNTTLLLADKQGISVDTGALTSLVLSDRPWTRNVAVDARQLIAVCGKLKKLGAEGEEIEISLDGRNLLMKFRSTGISIPSYPTQKP